MQKEKSPPKARLRPHEIKKKRLKHLNIHTPKLGSGNMSQGPGQTRRTLHDTSKDGATTILEARMPTQKKSEFHEFHIFEKNPKMISCVCTYVRVMDCL